MAPEHHRTLELKEQAKMMFTKTVRVHVWPNFPLDARVYSLLAAIEIPFLGRRGAIDYGQPADELNPFLQLCPTLESNNLPIFSMSGYQFDKDKGNDDDEGYEADDEGSSTGGNIRELTGRSAPMDIQNQNPPTAQQAPNPYSVSGPAQNDGGDNSSVQNHSGSLNLVRAYPHFYWQHPLHTLDRRRSDPDAPSAAATTQSSSSDSHHSSSDVSVISCTSLASMDVDSMAVVASKARHRSRLLPMRIHSSRSQRANLTITIPPPFSSEDTASPSSAYSAPARFSPLSPRTEAWLRHVSTHISEIYESYSSRSTFILPSHYPMVYDANKPHQAQTPHAAS